jgi:Ca2+-binding RTX toxin-like protein
VSGTAGANGWYVSDVSVTWDVSDADSAVTEQTGCDPASVTSDTVGTSFACSATSEDGSSSASVSVKPDVTPPTVTCGAPPVFDLFQIGVSVPASVADVTSGPLPAVARGVAITSKAGSFMSSVTGTDAAGNDVINGTKGNDWIDGQASPDSIRGGAGTDTCLSGETRMSSCEL